MKAITIGGAMVDTIALVEDALIERMSMSNAGKTFLLLEQGSKTEASSISTHCGGGAINAGVALSRLGFDVSVMAKVGNDARSELVRQTLSSEGITARWLRTTDAAPTGASAIISAHDRNAALFTFRGANTELAAADLDRSMFDVDLVYVSTLSGGSADILPEVVRLSAKVGARVAVNPGIRQISTRFQVIHGLLPQVGILALNRSEAEAFVQQAVSELAGSENATLRRLAAKSLDVAREAHRVSRNEVARALIIGLRQLGAPVTLLTDGRFGSYVGHDGQILYCPSHEVSVVSSAGAGDAFVSTFAGWLVECGNFEAAMVAATVNASSVVTRADSQSGLLEQEELSRRVDELRHKIAITQWTEKD